MQFYTMTSTVRLSDQFKCSLLSLNVRGLNDARKRRKIFTWLHHQSADIIFLQETYSTPEVEIMWKNEWGGKLIFSHGTRHSRGVAICFKSKLNFDIKTVKTCNDGRFIYLDILIDDSPFKLLNLYAPNRAKCQTNFLLQIKNLLLKEDCINSNELIIGGDFNCVLDPSLDKKGGTESDNKSRVVNTIGLLMHTFDLHDIWRIKNPDVQKFTWRQKKPPVYCRLDYWIISDCLHEYIKVADIKCTPFSDHSAITLCLESPKFESQRIGYWKFNSSLTTDKNYEELIKTKIPLWLEENKEITDKRIMWDFIKYKIRKETISFSKNKSKCSRRHEQYLNEQIKRLEETIPFDESEENISKLENFKTELDDLYNKRTNGAILRSKARWHEEGEKSTKYFMSLEKRNQSRKCMKKLQLEDSTIIEDSAAILAQQKNYYKKLYSRSENKSNEEISDVFFNNTALTELNEDEKNSCEGLLSHNSCFKIICQMKNNKSPGSDGLTAEFYKTFWSSVGDLVVASFNELYKSGELSTSQKQSIIVLLAKKDTDRQFLKNWRPISLLNTDYKIAASVLALRIKTVLPSLIHSDQIGYIKGRLINDAVRTIADIIHHTNKENKPGALLFLDFKKAFDTVSFNYLLKCLKRFNFGPSFINWIQVLYKNANSCVMNGGISSGFFNIERGVRQGDPLSPYLFIIGIELLASAIRENDQIRGISVVNKIIKTVLYADDITVAVNDKHSAKILFEIIEKFKKLSGLEINREKTYGMWLGSDKNSKQRPFGIKWPEKPIKTLGVYFSADTGENVKINFDEKIEKLKSKLNIWTSRDLTIFGRSCIVNTLGLSQFIYLASLVVFPENVIKTIEQLVSNFIWRGRKAKVKRQTLINKTEDGGIGLIDIRSKVKSLQCYWVVRYASEGEALWKRIWNHHLKSVGNNLFLYCNYDPAAIECMKIFPLYYKHVLMSWAEISQNTPTSAEEVGNQLIWNNRFIKVDHKPIFYGHFFESGAIRIKDLFYSNKNLKPFKYWVEKGIESNSFFKWIAIVDAIPKDWKILIKNNDCVANCGKEGFKICIKSEQYTLNSLKNNILYESFLSKRSLPPTNKVRLNNIFDIQEEEWINIYCLPKTVNVDHKTKELQYKILNNYLNTNARLKRIKILDDDLCSFCNEEAETLEHLFLSCAHVKKFWNEFLGWYLQFSQTEINIDYRTVVLGWRTADPPLLENFILLTGQILHFQKQN